jgi:fucose permease
MPSTTPDAAGTPAAVHRAYRDLAVVGYLLYGVGAVSPFIRDALGLSDTETGLHSSFIAIGMLAAGFAADRLDRRTGPSRIHGASALVAAIAIALLAWSPALAATLLASGLIGLSCGVLLGHVNDQLGSGGGPESRRRMLRANFFAMVGPMLIPTTITIAVAAGLGWQVAFLPALALLGWLFADSLRHGIPLGDRPAATGRLPRPYWLGWLLLVVVVGVETSCGFWGSTLVQRRTGVPAADAALVTGGFFLGMLIGRGALGLDRFVRQRPEHLVRAGLGLAILGALIAWLAPSVPVGAAGLFIAGLGISGQYPLGVTMTLPLGAEAPAAAAARLTLASGTAVLLAPLVLGASADLAGVEIAWLLIPTLAVIAIILSVAIDRPQGAATGPVVGPA